MQVKLPVTFLYNGDGIGSGTECIYLTGQEITLKKLVKSLATSRCLVLRDSDQKYVIARVRWTTDDKNTANIAKSEWKILDTLTGNTTIEKNELEEITLFQADTILVPKDK